LFYIMGGLQSFFNLLLEVTAHGTTRRGCRIFNNGSLSILKDIIYQSQINNINAQFRIDNIAKVMCYCSFVYGSFHNLTLLTYADFPDFRSFFKIFPAKVVLSMLGYKLEAKWFRIMVIDKDKCFSCIQLVKGLKNSGVFFVRRNLACVKFLFGISHNR